MCRRKSELRALPMNTTSVCSGPAVPELGRDSVRNGQKWGRAVGSAQCQHYLAKQLQPIADAILVPLGDSCTGRISPQKPLL